LTYVVGIQSTTTVWKPGDEPKPAPARKGNIGRPRKLLQRDAKNQPVSVKELARSLPAEAWKKVTWRQAGEAETALPLWRPAGAPRAPRLLAIGTAPGGMVADRMAGRGSRANQILAIHSFHRGHAGGTRA